ncbi:MAG: hypothetical protein AB7F91_14505 [Parvularculaceae bacterium]
MTRKNISIPDELEAEMQRIQGVNWSRIAQDAFTAAVAQWKIRNKEVMDMEAVATRLKESKKTYEAELEAEGTADGKEWASENADYGEMQRMLSDRFQHAEDPHDIAECISPSEHAGDFWQRIAGDDYELKVSEPAYVNGFVNGAMGVFKEVASKL